MRPNGRGNGRRLLGQLHKNMDRSNDSVLHRIRGQSGERINAHNRQPPKGPRSSVGGPNNRQFNGGLPNGPKGRGMPNGPQGANPQFSPQQKMQLFGLLSQMLSPCYAFQCSSRYDDAWYARAGHQPQFSRPKSEQWQISFRPCRRPSSP